MRVPCIACRAEQSHNATCQQVSWRRCLSYFRSAWPISLQLATACRRRYVLPVSSLSWISAQEERRRRRRRVSWLHPTQRLDGLRDQPSATRYSQSVDTYDTLQKFNPIDAHRCHMGTAIIHPVLDRVKPSFVIFDIRALWHSAPSAILIWQFCLFAVRPSVCLSVCLVFCYSVKTVKHIGDMFSLSYSGFLVFCEQT